MLKHELQPSPHPLVQPLEFTLQRVFRDLKSPTAFDLPGMLKHELQPSPHPMVQPLEFTLQRVLRKLLGFLLAIAFLPAIPLHACSVPVFRYALDHWPADNYRLSVPPSQSTGEVGALLRNLGNHSPINLEAEAARSADEGNEARLLRPDNAKAVWSGNLTADQFHSLTDSPLRRRIVQRIVEGASGVWIFIESGDEDLDEKEAERLTSRIEFLKQVAELPYMDPADPSNRLGPGPALKIHFPVLRLKAGNKEESALRAMLLGNDPAASNEPEPKAALVFGRGRALGCWALSELDSSSIDEACLFLLGACSCQVKNLNPGWDLLLTADWDEALWEQARKSDVNSKVADASEGAGESQPQIESITFEPDPPQPVVQNSAIPKSRTVIGWGVILPILAGFLMLTILFRR